MKYALLYFSVFLVSTTAWAYRKVSVSEIQGLDWVINGPEDRLLDLDKPEKKVILRDLNWIQDHKNSTWPQRDKSKLTLNDLRRVKNKKTICYMNLGRMQADPFGVQIAHKVSDRTARALALEKAMEKRSAAYEGVYRHYQVFEKEDLCYQKGDSWNEPWISWKTKEQKRKALQAYKRILQEASTECDAMDFDNTDISGQFEGARCGNEDDVVEMLRKVCSITHDLGMSCLLKNSDDFVERVSDLFDISLMEQCFTRQKEGAWRITKAFQGKPSVCVEYRLADVEKEFHYRRDFKKDCEVAKKNGISYFFVESMQSVQGHPYPNMECRLEARGGEASERSGAKPGIDAR